MEWRARSTGEGAEVLSPPFELPNLIRQVLQSRGLFHSARVEDWLAPKLKDLRDPSCLINMDTAVMRLVRAFEHNEKVCIYADFDLDGTSGLALLKCGLEQLGFQQVQFYQPRRLSEGYGVHADAITKISETGCKLVVTVDVGITAFAAANRARELGVEMIITDHHLPQEQLPDALAVVNPNQAGCNSKLGHLSGAGVAFYLLLAVKRELQGRGLLRANFDVKEVLDFYVIGTLTDLVPLIEENRVLVKHGLVQLGRTRRPGLRALLETLEMQDRPLSSADVAIKFAPKLNALSRMDQGILPIDILLVNNASEAQELVKKMIATNQLRQQLQASAEADALARAEDQVGNGFIWLYSPDYHKGVIGLVATRLAKHFHLPAFVGYLNDEGKIAGSARAPNGNQYHLVEIMGSATDVLTRFGGHAQAAGFEVDQQHAVVFGERVKAYLRDYPERLVPPLYYDGAGELLDINDHFLKWFDSLEPFGTSFEAPLFLLRNVRASEVKVLRGGHLRLTITALAAPSRQAIWFSPGVPTATFDALQGGAHFDLIAQAGWNYFRGQKTFQLMVQDLKLQPRA